MGAGVIIWMPPAGRRGSNLAVVELDARVPEGGGALFRAVVEADFSEAEDCSSSVELGSEVVMSVAEAVVLEGVMFSDPDVREGAAEVEPGRATDH